LRGIVGLRMPITRLDAKRKMSQNRRADDRAGVVAGLSASADPLDRQVADMVPRD
jgi:transcriptional regulator